MLYRSCCFVCMLALLALTSGCQAPVAPLAQAPAAASPRPAVSPAAPSSATAAPSPLPTEAERGLVLIGALELNPSGQSAHADVAGYKNLAFVGKWQGACVATGVDIIDISNPSAPVRLAATSPRTGLAMEDMQAIEIGGRDVLAIGLQSCRGGGQAGLELVDVSDPRNPQSLSLFTTEMGVHEFGLTQTPGGRTLALLAVPGLEGRTADDAQRGGDGDLLVVDISDPTQPVLASEWGVLDDPALGPEFALLAQQGSFPGTFLHSVRANDAGTRAYLSYWDAGVIMLDLTDPAAPRYLGRTTFTPDQEGNAHSIAVTPDDTLLVEAIEDFSPRDRMLTTSAGSRMVLAVPYAGADAEWEGEIVDVGRGCPAGSLPDAPTDDAYLTDPRGKIALIEGGSCRADGQIARAQLAGASGAIIYGSSISQDSAALYQGDREVELADGTSVTLSIPAVIAPLSVGRALREAASPLSVRIEEAFTGWGGLRIFNIADPANPIQLSSFATRNATDADQPNRGPSSAHNPDIRGTIVYTSWYRDGIRVIDLTDLDQPYEISSWVGMGQPDDAPPVNIWGVVVHGDLLLASDFNYGLYILKLF